MITREANRAQNLKEFEEGRTKLRSRPRVLFVELTENCNFSCPMCRSGGPFDRSKNMSVELFERIAAELFPTAEIVDLRGWGESTILRRFPEFVDKTLSYGCRVRLVTNLSVPNERLWRHLVRNRALIAVSFDAAEEATFESLRHGAKFRTILRNLEILADEARVSGVGTDNIHLNVVVQAQALGELSQIVTLAGRLGFRVHLNPVTLDHDDPENLRFHRDQLAEALAEAATVAEETGTEVRFDTALGEDWALTEHTAKTCTHPWMYCYFNYAGRVGFCDHLIGQPGESYLLGDLTTTSFEEIWNGPSYQQLRAEHAAWEQGISSRFEECNWCYRNRYVDFDAETNPHYSEHIVRLTPATCPAGTGRSVQRPASPGRTQHFLPITDVTHQPRPS
ncbi:radical SAM/SPASM domain-containing protein [Streptomyces acidicola]|uniref:radical SAM/SPASM domain-containing protein n=1 Tax=Streptomyces acidicola TaxID=2596892 RepID=UPI00379509EE